MPKKKEKKEAEKKMPTEAENNQALFERLDNGEPLPIPIPADILAREKEAAAQKREEQQRRQYLVYPHNLMSIHMLSECINLWYTWKYFPRYCAPELIKNFRIEIVPAALDMLVPFLGLDISVFEPGPIARDIVSLTYFMGWIWMALFAGAGFMMCFTGMKYFQYMYLSLFGIMIWFVPFLAHVTPYFSGTIFALRIWGAVYMFNFEDWFEVYPAPYISDFVNWLTEDPIVKEYEEYQKKKKLMAAKGDEESSTKQQKGTKVPQQKAKAGVTKRRKNA